MPDRDWALRAACRGHDKPDMWFPDPADHDTRRQAARICRSCPVIVECAADGRNQRWGIWGGRYRCTIHQRPSRTRPPGSPDTHAAAKTPALAVVGQGGGVEAGEGE